MLMSNKIKYIYWYIKGVVMMDDARKELRSIIRMMDHDRFIEACNTVNEIGVHVGADFDGYKLWQLRKQMWDECGMVLWNRLEGDTIWFVKLEVLKELCNNVDLLESRDPEDRRMLACIEMIIDDPLGFEFSEVNRKKWSSEL